jgi:hypothetical protein
VRHESRLVCLRRALLRDERLVRVSEALSNYQVIPLLSARLLQASRRASPAA